MPQLCWVVANARGRCHWDLRSSSLRGHETLYWVGETRSARSVLRGGGRMRAVSLGPSVGSLWGHETLHWVTW
eukprot:4368422-Pyramimonas_sp.AAC.2